MEDLALALKSTLPIEGYDNDSFIFGPFRGEVRVAPHSDHCTLANL